MTLPLFDIPGYPATWSADRAHRYTLWRVWSDPARYVQFVGLNPSTATEEKNDNTVSRCIAYAQRWGYGAMVMTNLFGYRTTYPAVMRTADDPIGADNDYWLAHVARRAELVVACWGCHGAYQERAQAVLELLGGIKPVHCLRLTKEGFPHHPLRLPGDLQPALFETAGAA